MSMYQNLKVIESNLSDGSHVYAVRFDNREGMRLTIHCATEKDAHTLFNILLDSSVDVDLSP